MTTQTTEMAMAGAAGSGTTSRVLGATLQNSPLKKAFLGWQCRARQMSMRKEEGRPTAAFMPEITLPGESEPMGSVVTVMSKSAEYSKTPEIMHIAKRTQDPSQRRSKGLELFSEFYYQKGHEFSDVLTATFLPDSAGAKALLDAGRCRLHFSAFNQQFDLDCAVLRLEKGEPLYESTWWHNVLFNPSLHPETIIIGFEPDWSKSSSDPEIG